MRCAKWLDKDFLNKARETCERSPTTYAEIEKVIDFYDVYPEISDLSIWAARPLVYEKNKKIQLAAIEAVKSKMAARSDIHSPDFSIARAVLTGDQVREIVNNQHILLEGSDVEREKLAKRKEQEGKEQLYECPSCHNLISILLSKRDKIVSLRVTEEEDNMYTYISSELGVSRSKLLSVILQAKYKYPNSFS
jgi:hypothetical protein